MKMAKANERDVKAACNLMAILDAISVGRFPTLDDPDEDAPEWFDPDDKKHLRTLYDLLYDLLDKAPVFPGRIIGGMCYVIMYDQNEIVDPDADTLELHPRLISALRDEQRLKYLLHRLPGDALRKVVGELSDTSDLIEFRGAIDAAIDASKEQST